MLKIIDEINTTTTKKIRCDKKILHLCVTVTLSNNNNYLVAISNNCFLTQISSHCNNFNRS